MLFRGETSVDWKSSDEAWDAAEQIAEYWTNVDYQDAIKDQAEQEAESE